MKAGIGRRVHAALAWRSRAASVAAGGATRS